MTTSQRVTRPGAARPSVCYVNPAVLLRRPISELLALEEGKRRTTLLIPRKGAECEKTLHHTALFKKTRIVSYRAWSPTRQFEWPIPSPGFIVHAWRALRDHDVVHVWAHFYLNNLLIMLLKPFFPRTKVILTMDTLPGYSFSAGRVLNVLFKIYTWTLGRIMFWAPDAITLYGDSLLPHAKRCRINARKIRVIPTGIVEHDVPLRTKARAKIEKERELDAKTRIVLYVGIINSRKRVDTVLDVAQAFKTKGREDTVFLIAGDGPSRNALENRARAAGLSNVRFLGWRKDVMTLMAAADAFLFPSSAEGLPGVVMEAAYAGTPVVTTNIPCTTDLVQDGKEGFLCKVGDTECFASRLATVLDDHRKARAFSQAGKRKMRTRYSWKRVAPMYEALYEELAGTTSKREEQVKRKLTKRTTS